MADLDDDQGSTLNKKIRSAQLSQYNYIFGKTYTRTLPPPHACPSPALTYPRLSLSLPPPPHFSLSGIHSGWREGATEWDSQREDERRETVRAEITGGSNDVTDGAPRESQQPGAFLRKHTCVTVEGKLPETEILSSLLVFDIYNKIMSFGNSFLCFLLQHRMVNITYIFETE